MFGILPFSTAPFSSLAGAVYSVSVDESASAADTLTALGVFATSISEGATASETLDRKIAKVSGTLDTTERELRQLLNLSPNRIEGLQLMTLLQLEQGRGAQAQTQLKELLAKANQPSPKPEALSIGLLLGDLQQRLGQRAEAAALYAKLAADFPRDPRPLLALALMRQEQGDSKGAQDALAQARSRQPDTKDTRLDQVAASWGLSNLRQQTAPKAPSPATKAPATAPPAP